MQKIAKLSIIKLKKILQNRGYKIYKNQKTIPKTFENFFECDSKPIQKVECKSTCLDCCIWLRSSKDEWTSFSCW